MASIQIKTDAELSEKYGPKARVMMNLFVDCLSEAIKVKTYPFTVAGLGASVSTGKGTNMYVSVSGHVPVKATYMKLLEEILRPMRKSFDEYTTPDTFDMVKKAIHRYYKNKLKAGARATASRVLWNTFSNTRVPVDEKIAVLQNTTFEDVNKFVPELLSRVSMEGFIYGQITETDAKDVYQKVQQTLTGTSHLSATTALPEASEFVSKMRVLPADAGPWYLRAKGSAGSNATILMIDGGHLPCDEAMALPVLYKVLGNRFFRELRTKQQTGYVASTYATTVARRSVVLMLVESSWAGAGDLLKRFEKFNADALAGINDGSVMPQAKLDSIKGAMLASFDKPIQNTGGMAGILEDIIKEFDGDFDVEKKKQIILEGLTREKIVKVANQVLGPQNKRKFAVLYAPDKLSDTVAQALLPSEYQKFNPTGAHAGVFKKKPKYVCDIDVAKPCNTTASEQDITLVDLEIAAAERVE